MSAPTRRELLAAAVTTAAATATATAVSPPAALAATSTTATSPAASDHMPLPERLGRLVEVEMLLLFCYERVLASGILSRRAHATLAPFVAHEQAHIAALERQMHTYGGKPPTPPADVHAANRDLAHRRIGGRLGRLKGDLDAVRLLLSTEQTVIGAYFVALRTVAEPGLIELICQIMANDAQHDAMLGLLLPPGTAGSAAPYGLVQGLE